MRCRKDKMGKEDIEFLKNQSTIWALLASMLIVAYSIMAMWGVFG